MAINLLNIKPHKVSRDLSGYITFIYGGYKTGKTTLAAQMDGALLLAFERGYNALPGVVAQDITSWTEMRTVYRELKKPEVKAVYKAVVVDTIDVASEFCKKYICQQNDIEDLGDLGYGKGWMKFRMNLTRSSAALLSSVMQFISSVMTKKVRMIKVILLISVRLFLMQPVRLLLA